MGMHDDLVQIGVVADRVGLSLRTIRWYEEVGLVVPAERSPGGFRLYSEENVGQLRLIKQMKPLDFTLEQMRDLLMTVQELHAEPAPDAARREELADRLGMYRSIVEARVHTLREQLLRAEDFAGMLRSPSSLRARG
jgi:DNA-binding transcriptional MerR regulator